MQLVVVSLRAPEVNHDAPQSKRRHLDHRRSSVPCGYWPQAGGVKFSFTFKPRFGMKALATPSVLYDYYNPEARAVVEPAQFVVQ